MQPSCKVNQIVNSVGNLEVLSPTVTSECTMMVFDPELETRTPSLSADLARDGMIVHEEQH